MMFVALNRKYARLKPIFKQPARDRLGKHKKAVFAMTLDDNVLKHIINKHYPLKATKVKVLKFIGSCGSITVNDLIDHFRYMPEGANNRIKSLAQEGLPTSWISPGQWFLTQRGERRLNYYAGKAKGNCAINVALAGDDGVTKR